METTFKSFIFVLKIAVLLFPLFFVLDFIVYPEYKYTLLGIRIGVTLYFLSAYYLAKKIHQKFLPPVVFSCVFLGAFALSLMCFITGDGFASPYYAGLLQVMMVFPLFVNFRPKPVSLLMALCISQHFILLSFIDFTPRDLIINIFAIGIIAIIALLIHRFIYGLVQEIRTLKGIIPICSNCKKVRDDQGYWHQVETYIRAHSNADFSHSICPDCLKVLYPDFID